MNGKLLEKIAGLFLTKWLVHDGEWLANRYVGKCRFMMLKCWIDDGINAIRALASVIPGTLITFSQINISF